MCGIIGYFNNEKAKELTQHGLEMIHNRGRDHSKIYGKKNNYVGHNLHSIVNFMPQPIIKKGVLVSNNEIYNWKELNKKYKLKAKNDSDLLIKLIEKIGLEKTLKELDGVYAFAYWVGNEIYLVRDIIGVKPLFYSLSGGFSFASESKVLNGEIKELNPREIIKYNIKSKKNKKTKREFFKITPQNKEPLPKIKFDLIKLIKDAIKKRIPNQKFGILLSGGIDSVLIAYLCKLLKKDFICYTAVFDDSKLNIPKDLTAAKEATKEYGFKHKIVKVKLRDVEKNISKVINLIEDSNVVKVGVALAIYFACEKAKKDKIKIIFSGMGADDLFAGYQRHRDSHNVNKECLSSILNIYERDTYRDDVITMNNNLELRIPFLDKALVDFVLKIPGKYKINDNNKLILRQIANELGIDKNYAYRKKIAIQYGSNFDQAIRKLTKKNKFKHKSEYLKSLYQKPNLKLAVLFSSGKDSCYALETMKKQNYEITCLVTLKSKNPDSYMFHTPNVDLVNLQAKAMDIPLLTQTTVGEKEKELKDLEEVLKKVKLKFKIGGVVTGALYSRYQRDRVEKICDKLGLKTFSPLWHMDQEKLLKELIKNNFKVIISSIAADGLDESWLGKEINESLIEKLNKLNKKNNLSMAGEGGEYESLVLNGPIFKKKIEITKSKIIMETENTGRFVVLKAKLE